MEYIEGINLMQIINTKADEEVVKKMAGQLFEGLAYLQRLGVVHRDIKHDNIMINFTK